MCVCKWGHTFFMLSCVLIVMSFKLSHSTHHNDFYARLFVGLWFCSKLMTKPFVVSIMVVFSESKMFPTPQKWQSKKGFLHWGNCSLWWSIFQYIRSNPPLLFYMFNLCFKFFFFFFKVVAMIKALIIV